MLIITLFLAFFYAQAFACGYPGPVSLIVYYGVTAALLWCLLYTGLSVAVERIKRSEMEAKAKQEERRRQK